VKKVNLYIQHGYAAIEREKPVHFPSYGPFEPLRINSSRYPSSLLRAGKRLCRTGLPHHHRSWIP
jgi:hypothetical protein